MLRVWFSLAYTGVIKDYYWKGGDPTVIMYDMHCVLYTSSLQY